MTEKGPIRENGISFRIIGEFTIGTDTYEVLLAEETPNDQRESPGIIIQEVTSGDVIGSVIGEFDGNNPDVTVFQEESIYFAERSEKLKKELFKGTIRATLKGLSPMPPAVDVWRTKKTYDEIVVPEGTQQAQARRHQAAMPKAQEEAYRELVEEEKKKGEHNELVIYGPFAPGDSYTISHK